MDLKGMIRTVPDFPKKGIMFRDITTSSKTAAALDEAATRLAERFRAKRPEIVLGIESRGFILGAAVALKLGVGFAPVRKKGKLPARRSARSTRSSTGPIASRCTPTRWRGPARPAD